MRKTCGKGRMQQPPTTPSNMTTIPTKKDINPTPGNLDELTALKHFHGKSQSEAANLFFECPTYYEEDYCAIIGLNQKDLENQGILA